MVLWRLWPLTLVQKIPPLRMYSSGLKPWEKQSHPACLVKKAEPQQGSLTLCNYIPNLNLMRIWHSSFIPGSTIHIMHYLGINVLIFAILSSASSLSSANFPPPVFKTTAKLTKAKSSARHRKEVWSGQFSLSVSSSLTDWDTYHFTVHQGRV